MSVLTVYKASAGSGKTWRLTVEYLKLLLKNPESYKSILAVTFTNKATGEMKERVLGGLYDLMNIDISDEPEGMLKTLCEDLDLSPSEAKKRARVAMSSLLHDYGRFRIETIDSFFQSILRNLARELGLGAWLNIEIDSRKVLNEAIESMIDKSSEDPILLNWMTDFMEEMVENGKSWRIENKLKDFGNNIFQEYFKEKEKILDIELKDKDFLRKFKKQLKGIEENAKKIMEKSADDFFRVLEESGFSINDLSNKESGASSFFLNLKKGDFSSSISDKVRVRECMDNPEKWVKTNHSQKNELLLMASEKLTPLLIKAEEIRKNHYPDYISSSLASSHLNKVGLLADISAEVRELNRENNRFILSDTNALLKSMLEDSDASFVYEKTGTEINHILFDEFQDTSRMQWETFKPLLAEGLSNGNDSLIVGDEKQSIYRWRNGDWRILGSIANEMAPSIVHEKYLEYNWRSDRNIIDFNNAIFSGLEKEFNNLHKNLFGTESQELSKAYSDVKQLSGKKLQEGLVEISFLNDNQKGHDEYVLDKLVSKVEDLQRSGIKPEQIAILIRRNKDIPRIGIYFSKYKTSDRKDPDLCYDIVSDDAFLLDSSRSVRIIIDAFRLLSDPSNPISQSLLKLDYQKDVKNYSGNMNHIFRQTNSIKQNPLSEKTGYKKAFIDTNPEALLLPEEFVINFEKLQRMPLYEMAEEIYKIFNLDLIPAQDSYLYCFMDKLSEYLLHAPSDLASFLKHWDEIMYKTSIPAGSSINGIRILSIHKSKGLEFHTVIIPFCDWKILSEVSSFQIWCNPEVEPYNQLALLPIDYKEELKYSVFYKEYEEETLQLWVDSINLLYVAFTRAKHNLIVFCKNSDNKKVDKKPVSIDNMLQIVLESGDNLSSNISENSTNPEPLFTLGKLNISENKSKIEERGFNQKGRDISLPFRSFAHKTRFRQSNRSLEFSKGYDPEGFTSSYIDRGKLLHKLFSEIRQKTDLTSAIKKLIYEGIIESEEAESYLTIAEKAISNSNVSDWYSGKYKLFNECSIICSGPDGKHRIKRPDRVMLSSDGVKVVDFKFGKPSHKYHKQVLEYMKLLTDMGYNVVEGYLWYVDDDMVEKVNS